MFPIVSRMSPSMPVSNDTVNVANLFSPLRSYFPRVLFTTPCDEKNYFELSPESLLTASIFQDTLINLRCQSKGACNFNGVLSHYWAQVSHYASVGSVCESYSRSEASDQRETLNSWLNLCPNWLLVRWLLEKHCCPRFGNSRPPSANSHLTCGISMWWNAHLKRWSWFSWCYLGPNDS